MTTSTFSARFKRNLPGTLNRSITILCSILLGVLAGSIIMMWYGVDPIKVYSSLLQGAFLSEKGRFVTIQRATPLIFTAIASALAFRTGVFNVGVEGQFFIGAITATYVGYAVNLPMIIHLPLTLFAGFLGGAAWAYIPTLMRQKLGVSEIITTIMANYIASNLVSYLTNYPMKAKPTVAETPFVLPSATLAQFVDINPQLGRGTQANVGIFIALIMVFVMWYIFKRTKIGYEWRLVGLSPLFSEFSGINLTRTFIGGMLVSGGLAGLWSLVTPLHDVEVFFTAEVTPHHWKETYIPDHSTDPLYRPPITTC